MPRRLSKSATDGTSTPYTRPYQACPPKPSLPFYPMRIGYSTWMVVSTAPSGCIGRVAASRLELCRSVLLIRFGMLA